MNASRERGSIKPPDSKGSSNLPPRKRTRSFEELVFDAPKREFTIGRRVATRVALATFYAGALFALAAGLIAFAQGLVEPAFGLLLLMAAIVAALSAFFSVHRIFARRLSRVASFVEDKIHDRGQHSSASKPLIDEGDDELARVASAINRLISTVNASTSVGDGDSAAITQRNLRLEADLAKRTLELEQRVRERALLFDVLRESASNPNVDSVLKILVDKLGPALRLREAAVLIRDRAERLEARAVWGFDEPEAVLGRRVNMGEGIAGKAAKAGASVLLSNVADEPDYISFWGEAPRTGSFVGAPIRARGELIGMITVTRPTEDPLTEHEQRYLQALADQVSMAIKNAQLFEQLEELSTHDPLTHLPNRRLFESRLDRDVAEARRYRHPFSLLAIDIDHFKMLNDREGHQAGDQALVAMAEALSTDLREVDTVARAGGEEFWILLSRADREEATQVAEKIRQRVMQVKVRGAEKQPLGFLSVSLGVATFLRSDSKESFLARADAALYRAKNNGRNRVEVDLAETASMEIPQGSDE